jgi:hypothetical protein
LEEIAQMGQRLYQYVAICDYASSAVPDRGLTSPLATGRCYSAFECHLARDLRRWLALNSKSL